MFSNQKQVSINALVFTSSLSKGAKLLYGALEGLPHSEAHPGQQELDLGLEPPAIGVVAYHAAELAAYMHCGVASIRRYTQELIAAGWANWHMGKARGKGRKLVLQLEKAQTPQSQPTIKRKTVLSAKPVQLEAFEKSVPAHSPQRAMPTVLQETVEPQDRDQLFLEMKAAVAKINKRVFARGMMPLEYAFAPLTLEDLQTLWASWDAHNPALYDDDVDTQLQSHMNAVKTSQEPYSAIRVGKMLHLYTGALSLRREMEPLVHAQ